ncbi:uncharacterized protein LACBIDRAFT_291543 [Laccaria bicolor S238N-H82]|uniref:Predicted protein n=1 Tax=Laccaria bicolor (strain S238N-H82 / ATCC MYA-4686) TaxID=486041 RepID=B0CQI7_LACBS|nr:uncharacterized protein LACBIDRAFT_291543 [Laccaria bicolor S238N-H82]EDR15652.1 predicted protein [Laccaria bicolor S238N-H82]|eukprot:XP_001873860.1 predicted protein [Laccaria bicolor S238N-H82]
MKQVEAIIEEEPETADEIVETSNDASRSNSKNVPDTVNGAQPSTAQADLGTSDDILSVSEVDKRVAEALRPLHEQLRALKSQVEEIQHLKTELADLKPQIADLKNLRAKVDALTSEIRELRTQQGTVDVDEMMADSVHEPVTPPQQSTPQPKTPKTYGPGGFGMPSAFRTPSSTAIVPKASSAGVHDSEYNPTEAHPGVAASMLGKRHRDSVGSSITGIVEEGHEDEYSEEELAKRVRSSAPHVPSFTVFRGPEGPAESYVGSPPPTNHLPEYFDSTDSGNRAGRLGHGAASTSSATASENQQPFNFTFLPISSTPANAITDVFKPYGLPSPPKRLPSFASGSQPALRETFVDPAALTQRSSGKQREVSTNDGEAESTNAERKSDAAPGANVPSTKRTMYGTELEGDTRFGDFGMDGVASIGNLGAGFWAGGRF